MTLLRSNRAAPIAWMACALAACGGAGGDAADAASNNGDGAVIIDARPTAGCAATGATAGVHDERISVRGTERSYLVAVPADYTTAKSYAVVFAWHGRGSNAAQARAYFGVEAQAAGDALVVYPQGLGLNGNPSDTGWDLASDGDDVALFDAILAVIEAEYCVDSARVFSTGHSFGGFMSNQLGCARGNVLRAIAPVAGGGPYGGCTGDPVAALVIHGSQDTVVVPAMGEGSRDHWLSANGCGTDTTPTAPEPCVAYAGCTAPVHWCLHDESDALLAGHTWPTFAAQSIWAFFAAFE